ncbi:putative cyanohydrin beta-glucosyltransferase [Helianthus debilis subsp. tardiflorus]
MVRPHVLLLPAPAQGHVIPATELGQRLVKQGAKVTVINTEATHKVITTNWLENDGCEDLMQMVSIPDGLEPWEDRNELGKLMESMEKSMPTKLEQLIETILTNKMTTKSHVLLLIFGWHWLYKLQRRWK